MSRWDDLLELSQDDIRFVKNELIPNYDKYEESIKAIREWVDIMRDEPEEWIKLSEVYHSLRRMLGDE